MRKFSVHLPDHDDVIKFDFDLKSSTLVIKDALAIGFREDGFLIATAPPCELDISHDPAGEVAELVDISRELAEFVIRHFLVEVRGGEASTSIESYHLTTLPLLRDLKKAHTELQVPAAFDEGLHAALAAPNPRIGAAKFWGEDSVGAQAATVFMKALVEDNKTSANRAAWLGLAPSTLRHELVEAPLVSVSHLRPLNTWRAVVSELQPRACVEFVRYAMTQGNSISIVASAYALGLKARGRDHVRAFNDLVADVHRRGLGRPKNLAAFMVANGIAGHTTSLLSTRQDCVVAATTLNNCLNNPSQPYKDQIITGRTVVLAVGENWDQAAIAINPRTNQIIEQKGHKNSPVPEALRVAIDELVERWKAEQVVAK